MTTKKITKYVCENGHEFNEQFDQCPACQRVEEDKAKHKQKMENYEAWQSKRNYREVDSCSNCVFSIDNTWERHQINCNHPIKTIGAENFPFLFATAEPNCICDYYKRE